MIQKHNTLLYNYIQYCSRTSSIVEVILSGNTKNNYRCIKHSLKHSDPHKKGRKRFGHVLSASFTYHATELNAYEVAVKHPQTTYCNYYSSCVRRVVDRNTARCRNNRGEMTKPESGAAARVHFWGKTASALFGIIPTCLK